ncbi:CLAVATA3/ESR (CLE)-related protein 45 [Morella rubra]|uniref:CLAVATA3/ESR (CLE)-related protein 45 n=1 Tax=Morella rubra TaxID=262757 RepID=A0A6A1V972_9ROSI|nr:CLAVATA3/ESR (CLE)-related protein 45 [Morella rubra]KAB1208347.1 CLAVATA3/ESR (CLE)-related protein 45 [Morella rubra]
MEHKNRRLTSSDLLILLFPLTRNILLSSCLLRAEAMVSSADRALILVICIGFLAFRPDKVSGLRSIDLAIKQGQEAHGIMAQSRRVLKAVAMEGMNTEKKSAYVNKKSDPNQSSKRRVRRGSDPIHNRS